jgi:hypothetical protein
VRALSEKSAHAGVPRRRLAAAAAALALWLGSPTVGAADALTESQVKASFVFNFARYVEWPAGVFATPQAPLVLCVAAKDALGGALAAIEGKTVQGRVLQVRRGVKSDEIKSCQILFVPESEAPATMELLRKVGRLPVLTIGEREGFAAAGGCIGFVPGDERVRFEINPDAASRAGLTISSQLLRLATIVRDAGKGPQ